MIASDRSNARYALITFIIIVFYSGGVAFTEPVLLLLFCLIVRIQLHDVTTLATRDVPAIDSVSDA